MSVRLPDATGYSEQPFVHALCESAFYVRIAVGEDVKGDFIRINGTKFLVCDPTYIGAPIGMTMPDMDNKTAKVIVLN